MTRSITSHVIQVEIDDPNKTRPAAIASNTLNQKGVQNIDEKASLKKKILSFFLLRFIY